MNELLTPGVYVRHPDEPEWGIGQVQSNIDGRITVNFEHRGKQVINGEKIRLSIAQPFDSESLRWLPQVCQQRVSL